MTDMTLTLLGHMTLPTHRKSGGFDHAAVHAATGHVYVAHTANDAIDVMMAKMNEFPGWPIYKIKLGTDRDLEIVAALRKHTGAIFRVDANCGWTAEQTIGWTLAGLAG